jgi:SAM-dependent methyltransferase
MSQLLRYDDHCRICGSRQVETVLQLTDTPLEDRFLRHPRFQQTFPLEVALCEQCGYLHLPYIVNPEASYSEYLYVSAVTEGLRNHYDAYAREIVSGFDISQGALAVDLGSNDGSMLASFKRSGMRVVGVEPANAAAKAANDRGLTTLVDYFTDTVAERIRRKEGPAGLVTANYMFANVEDPIAFVRSVVRLLDKDGLFVVQTGYHPEQMKINMFDYIYHEHFSYFTVEVLQYLFSMCGLELIDAVKTSPKGGSLRVVAQLQGGTHPVRPSVSMLIEEERASGMRNQETYRRFAERIRSSRESVRAHLDTLKSQGSTIVGFGASHSTTTLLYHFGLDDYLEYLVDDNTLKHGTYSPGKHLPVYPADRLSQEEPCHILLLAWQHRETIIEKHKRLLDSGSTFIVPLPSLRVYP